LRCELSDLEQVQAERLDLGQYAVQRGPVQQPGEHGVRAVPPVCPGALSPVRLAMQSKAMAKAGRNQHIQRLSMVDRVCGAPVARITVIR
jgi:hypothetical protein